MQTGPEPACEIHDSPSAREGDRVGGVAFPESVPSGVQDRPGTSLLPRVGVDMSIVWAARSGSAMTRSRRFADLTYWLLTPTL